MIRRNTLLQTLVLALLIPAASLPAGAEPPGDEAPMGPLGGRNMYAPHLPWFSFPAESAPALAKGTLRTRLGLYYINEFSSYPFSETTHPPEPDGKLSRAHQDELTALDYESTVIELGMDWQAAARWRFSMDWRLHFRYGGFLDGFIEGWHNLLGVANAGREYFDRNRSAWNDRGSTVDDFSGSGTVIASGDLDIRAVYTILERQKVALAAGGAFKIPAGSDSGGFSSGYPDVGLEIIADWRPWTRWIFFGTAAVIVPLGPRGRIMVQFIPGIEFRAFRNFSFLLQMNLQTSPAAGYSSDGYIHPIFGSTTMFSLMQMDVKFGFKGRMGNFGWQFYFEEDPLTWEGPDILVYFGVDRSFGGPDG